MSYQAESYVFDNCINSAQSLKNYVSSNFSNIEKLFAPTTQYLSKWNDRRGRKTSNAFNNEVMRITERISEAVSLISSDVDKCVSTVNSAKNAYNSSVKYLSSSKKFYSEWRGITL